MGAKATQRKVVDKQSATKIRDTAKKLGVDVSGGGGYAGLSVKASVGYKQSNKENFKQKLDEETKESKEFYIGGSAPEGKFDDGDTESLRNWARSAQENPAPVDYQLLSLPDLIHSDDVFKVPIDGKFSVYTLIQLKAEFVHQLLPIYRAYGLFWLCQIAGFAPRITVSYSWLILHIHLNILPFCYMYLLQHELSLSEENLCFEVCFSDVVTRRKCLRLAIKKYCLEQIGDALTCQNSGKSVQQTNRKKRSTTQYEKPIK